MTSRRAPGVRLIALGAAALAAAGWLAAARVHSLERSHLGPLLGHVHRGELTLLRPPRTTRSGGWTTLARLAADPVMLRVSPAIAARVPARSLGQGDIVSGLFAVAPTDDFARAMHAHGGARAIRLDPTRSRRGGAPGFVDSVRRRAQSALAHGLPPPQAALLRGMVLGDDSALPRPVRDDFRAAGLSHLTAASGQNVVLLAALVVALAAAAGIGFRGRWAAAIALIVLYVPLAGGGPSIQRAGVMGVLGVIALLAARPQSRWYALAVAAVLTLGYDPRAISDPGWQMSFMAVVALLLLARPWSTRLARLGVPLPVAEAVAVTAAATLGTAPVIAAHFGTASPVTLAANVAAAPVVAPIMWLGMLSAAVGPGVPGAAVALNAFAAPLLGYLTQIARFAAGSPGAGLSAGPVLVGVACAALLAMAGRDRAVPRLRRAGALVLIALVTAAIATACVPDRVPPPPAGLRITFLDVGQGDATLIQDGPAAVLVDTGPPGAPLLARLRHAGVRRLAALVVTHAQADHDGGAAAVLGALPVGLVLDGRDGIRDAEGVHFATVAARRGVRLVTPQPGATLRSGRLAFSMLNPLPGPTAAATGEDPNNRAIVLELRDRGARVLLTADAESDVLARLPIGRTDLLKVSHHGSADEGLPALLRRLHPSAAVIEVGAQNTYGHPTPSTLAALRVVPGVFRTDRDGSVRADLVRGAWVIHTHALRRRSGIYSPGALSEPSWKPAFLIHGDDHGRVGERRASLRALAESGGGAIETFEGDAASPEAVANALCAMTFAMGRRFLIVDGAERWSEKDVKEHLQPALAALPPDTTVAFFGRDEGRAKVPEALVVAVRNAGGAVATEDTLKAKELPAWVAKEATRLGFSIDANAARALVDIVGERRQRLLRELEKLVLEHGAGARIETEEVEAAAAPSAERQVWGLVDAVVARDRATSIRRLLELEAQGESLARLVPLLAKRLREIETVASKLAAGESPGSIKATMKPPWLADRRLKEARGADVDALRRSIVALADLELATRGQSDLSEPTVALRTIASIAA